VVNSWRLSRARADIDTLAQAAAAPAHGCAPPATNLALRDNDITDSRRRHGRGHGRSPPRRRRSTGASSHLSDELATGASMSHRAPTDVGEGEVGWVCRTPTTGGGGGGGGANGRSSPFGVTRRGNPDRHLAVHDVPLSLLMAQRRLEASVVVVMGEHHGACPVASAATLESGEESNKDNVLHRLQAREYISPEEARGGGGGGGGVS
jgi:hypothetical protein